MPLVLPGEEVSLNAPGRTFARHHHLKAYAALIVSGSCDEAGDRGRFRAREGDVLVHLAFEAHQDRIGPRGASIVNFCVDQPLGAAFGAVADLDCVIRTHERDPAGAAALLREQFRARPQPDWDWPDRLAHRLRDPAPIRLGNWAEEQGLNAASLSRGFKLAYGVTPKRYRFEQMVSRAARGARESLDTLSSIAADSGFADQAHMTRAMVQMFGVSPLRLRRLS